MNILKSAKIYAELIKLGHTLFALPFALSALCIAYAQGYSLSVSKIFWIVVCFTAARSAAMGFNRVVDVDFDALNPRTKNRPTASGEISIFDANMFTMISAAIFVGAAWLINSMCFWLSFPALAILFGYSYAKRFTAAAHYILGIALALAPIGAWIAAADSLNPSILALGAALFFHISGFDIIYSLQDMEFDIEHGLHSLPSRFGRTFSLFMAAFSFAAATAMLFLTATLFELNYLFYLSSVLIAILYALGLAAIYKMGMKKINAVFFYENATISALILAAAITNII